MATRGQAVTCQHPDFAAKVEVIRLTEDGVNAHAYMAEVKVCCAACGEPFGWKGPLVGLSFSEPRVTPDALTLRAPLMTPAEMELAGPMHAMERGPMRFEVG